VSALPYDRIHAQFAFCNTPRVDGDVEYTGSEGHVVGFRRLTGSSEDRTIVYLQTGTIPFDSIDGDRAGRRMLDALRQFGTVLVFDRRGIGMSDPLPNELPAQQAWTEDLTKVVTAGTNGPVVLFAQQFMDFVLDVVSARPDLFEAVIWYEPTTDWLDPDAPDEIREIVEASVRGETDFLSVACPTRSGDRNFRSWFDHAGARGASPTVAKQLYARADPTRADQLRKLANRIEVPLLVFRRPGSLVGVRDEMPDDSVFAGATVVDIPGRDWHLHGEHVDAILNHVAGFILGAGAGPLFPPQRALAAVLFTDIVGSTDIAAKLGDAAWTNLISLHDFVVSTAVSEVGGWMVKSTGDGSLSSLPSAHGAIDAHARIRQQLSDESLPIRAGVHVGDVERRNDDISGLAVVAAARIMDRAQPGQLLVSSTVVATLLGSQHCFEPFETVQLKGLPGYWEIHESVPPTQPT
jgi:class 3 adenylate cyclase